MLTVYDVSTSSPFYTVSASDHLHHPGLGVHPGRRREPQGISPSHTGGLAKNRTPFHLATLALIQPPGVQQAGGRVHQGIARHGRLAKDRAPYLIRRNEPPTGALSSNAILRFEKAPHTYHIVFTVQRCPVRVALLFYRYFGRYVWPCVCRSSRPSRELCISIRG